MKTKYCRPCDTELPVTEFTKSASRKDGLQAYCREHMKEYRRQHYHKNKKAYIERARRTKQTLRKFVSRYKMERGCEQCGAQYPNEPWLFEIDHIEPNEKDNVIGQLISNGSSDAIEQELNKCQVLCVICHRRKTAKQQNWNYTP